MGILGYFCIYAELAPNQPIILLDKWQQAYKALINGHFSKVYYITGLLAPNYTPKTVFIKVHLFKHWKAGQNTLILLFIKV